jgi:hypothetical protein
VRRPRVRACGTKPVHDRRPDERGSTAEDQRLAELASRVLAVSPGRHERRA